MWAVVSHVSEVTFQTVACSSGCVMANICSKLDAPSEGLGLCGRSMGWQHKPTAVGSNAVVPGSKPKVAAVLAQSLGFRVDSTWRCKGKGSLLGTATSSVLLSGEEGTGFLMLGLCSEKLKCVFSRRVKMVVGER